MGPFIIAAAALLLTGCGAIRFRDSQYSHEDLRHPPENPLDSDPKAKWAYSEFKKLDVPDRQLDQGCTAIDYDKPGPNAQRVGKGDGSIWPCEVYEHALNHYEKYYHIARGIAEGPIPGELDDHNPETIFDLRIRQIIQGAIDELKSDPQLKIVENNTYVYQERLSVGLFYFSLFPQNPQVISENRKALEEWTMELEHLGLSDFREKLFSRGGLGLATFEGGEKYERERSALESLRDRVGDCTELSKILYGVFKQAGLKPFYVYSSYRNMKPVLDQYHLDPPFYYSLPIVRDVMGHAYIGLEMPNSKVTRYFDPSFGLPDVTYADYQHWGLIHFLGAEFNNQALHVYSRAQLGSRKQSERLVTQALRMDPDNPTIQSSEETIYSPGFYDNAFKIPANR